jgi:hypothetical protein
MTLLSGGLPADQWAHRGPTAPQHPGGPPRTAATPAGGDGSWPLSKNLNIISNSAGLRPARGPARPEPGPRTRGAKPPRGANSGGREFFCRGPWALRSAAITARAPYRSRPRRWGRRAAASGAAQFRRVFAARLLMLKAKHVKILNVHYSIARAPPAGKRKKIFYFLWLLCIVAPSKNYIARRAPPGPPPAWDNN